MGDPVPFLERSLKEKSYCVFDFPKQTNDIKIVKDILEKEAPKDCYINRPDIKIYGNEKKVVDPRRPLQIGTINNGGQGERIYSTYGAGITLSAFGGGAASKTGAYLVDGKVRKLTPRECARMQGFPESFILPESRNTAYKQFGDSVSVPVLKAIFAKIIEKYPGIKNKRDVFSLDKKIIQLLNMRANITLDIAQIKRRQGKSIYSPEREREVLRKLALNNKGPLKKDALEAIYREVMSSSPTTYTQGNSKPFAACIVISFTASASGSLSWSLSVSSVICCR